MANPFGSVVDNYYLDGMARYAGKAITQEDRAREAMRVKDGVSEEEARKYVADVKEYYGNGASTLCLIFNGTGYTLRYAYDHDYYGNIDRTPYPAEIGNGQWVSFLHVHTTAAPSGSEASVIYSGKQKDGLDREFTLAWSTPWSDFYKNKAYCEVHKAGHSSSWAEIYDRTNNSSYDHKVADDGAVVTVATASGSSPVFTAVLTIPYSP